VNKGKGSDALTRIMASRAFPAVARSVVFVLNHPDDKQTKVVGVPKSNLGSVREDALTQTYTITSAHIGYDERHDNIEITGAKVVWGDSIETSIDDLLMADVGEKPSKMKHACVEWLKAVLQAGPVFSSVVKLQGEQHEPRFAESTVKRVFASLGGVSTKSGFGGQTVWELPDEGPAMIDGLESAERDD
jgi:hypothetical protein